MNLAELQQKADRVIHNADEFVRKWVEFVSAPAGTVTLEYYDQNGNLRTASFSNRNKLVQDFIANANAVMSKTVYVDQVNGDDGNDGSESAPFKTLQKAVNSVPVGGYVNVVVQGDYTLGSDEVVEIFRKAVRLELRGTLSTTYGSYTENNGNDYARKGVFLLNGASLYIYINSNNNGKIVVPPNNTGLPYWPPTFGFIAVYSSSQAPSSIFLQIFTRVDNYNPILVESASFVGVWQWDVFRQPFSLSISGHYPGTGREIVVTSGNYLLHTQNSPVLFYYNYQGGLSDGSSSISVSQVVAGVIKDANGIPRNIVSNIVF